MSQSHWEKWINLTCPQEKNWSEMNSCLKESTLDFQDIVKYQSHPAEHKIKIHYYLGIAHILSLSNNSIQHVEDYDVENHYEICLNKALKYKIEIKDPSFSFLSPNPLAFPATRIKLQENSSDQFIYLQV